MALQKAPNSGPLMVVMKEPGLAVPWERDSERMLDGGSADRWDGACWALMRAASMVCQWAEWKAALKEDHLVNWLDWSAALLADLKGILWGATRVDPMAWK